MKVKVEERGTQNLPSRGYEIGSFLGHEISDGHGGRKVLNFHLSKEDRIVFRFFGRLRGLLEDKKAPLKAKV